MYNQYSEEPQFLFVGSPDELQTPISRVSNLPILLLKFRPKCKCGKEFRSSGLEKAKAQVTKHKSYKKYENCEPEIEEFNYTGKIPEFVTLAQCVGSDANTKRNQKLVGKIENQKEFADLRAIFCCGYQNEYKHSNDNWMQSLGVIYEPDTEIFWNTNTGEEVFAPELRMMDNYQITQGINIKGTISQKGQVRSVKQGTLQVCEVQFMDSDGKTMPMTLWNGQCSSVSEGDKVVLTNAYIKDGQYWAGRGFGYAERKELGLYKNASKMEVVA